MHKNLFLLPLVIALASPMAAGAKLKIGDPAPPLAAAKWFKGRPVTAFASNQVYVVEFWATWCGPCRKSIPHLTELAKKYDGKASILGFSIWESEKTNHQKRLAAVGKFVEGMGKEMDYIVAADDNEGSIAKNWMEAAEENGIPTAFIVGKDGRIAWLGYPWAGLDEALDGVVAGTLNTKAVLAADAARQKQKSGRAQTARWLQPVTELQKAGKFSEAIARLDECVTEHPELADQVGYLRYTLLLAHDEPAAFQLVRQLLTSELKNDANTLYRIARDLTDPPGRKTKDWDLAFDLTQHLCELSRFSNPSHLSTLAEAYFGKGDRAKAIETEEKAIRLGQLDPGFADSMKYLNRRLELFKGVRPAPNSAAKSS